MRGSRHCKSDVSRITLAQSKRFWTYVLGYAGAENECLLHALIPTAFGTPRPPTSATQPPPPLHAKHITRMTRLLQCGAYRQEEDALDNETIRAWMNEEFSSCARCRRKLYRGSPHLASADLDRLVFRVVLTRNRTTGDIAMACVRAVSCLHCMNVPSVTHLKLVAGDAAWRCMLARFKGAYDAAFEIAATAQTIPCDFAELLHQAVTLANRNSRALIEQVGAAINVCGRCYASNARHACAGCAYMRYCSAECEEEDAVRHVRHCGLTDETGVWFAQYTCAI